MTAVRARARNSVLYKLETELWTRLCAVWNDGSKRRNGHESKPITANGQQKFAAPNDLSRRHRWHNVGCVPISIEIQTSILFYGLLCAPSNVSRVSTYRPILCCAGMALRPMKLSAEQILLLSYPGEIFLRMLKLLTLPLLISSLITVTASLNSKLGGKVMLRTLTFFFVTSMISSAMGIGLTFLFRQEHAAPDNGTATTATGSQSKFLDSFLDLGR